MGDAYDAVFMYLNPAGGAFQDITLHPIIRWKQNAFIALNVQWDGLKYTICGQPTE
jgi:hypothetical protein